jgi:DNA-binding MarR family transcriptional regulator
MSDLAKRLKVSYGNVTGLVDRLVLANLVKRVNDLADRRIVRVALTTKGKKIVDEIKACRRKNIIHLLRKIPNKEKTILFGLLEKIATIIREEEQKS